MKAALLTGFWFLLRSIEYLPEDDGVFDPARSLTWNDVTPRQQRRVLPLNNIARADEVSLTLYSSKNSLKICTRDLKEVPGSELCVVAALKELHIANIKEFGKEPGGFGQSTKLEAVFKKDETKVYRREDISQVLKIAAAAAGIPDGRIASHSLRRRAEGVAPSTSQLGVNSMKWRPSIGGYTFCPSPMVHLGDQIEPRVSMRNGL